VRIDDYKTTSGSQIPVAFRVPICPWAVNAHTSAVWAFPVKLTAAEHSPSLAGSPKMSFSVTAGTLALNRGQVPVFESISAHKQEACHGNTPHGVHLHLYTLGAGACGDGAECI
jgi:hypothetical protein